MLIVGAKGFAKEILTVIFNDYPTEELVFFDDVSEKSPVSLYECYPILHSAEAAKHYLQKIDNRFVLGIGNPKLRRNLSDKFKQLGGKTTSIISQNAFVGKFGNQIAVGTCVLTNVIIEADNRIGEGCLLHVGTFVSHDTEIGKFCEISPFAKLLGGVEIGNGCSLGTGCVILPKVKLGNNVIVGANAVVSKNVPDNTVVVGVPAKPLIK